MRGREAPQVLAADLRTMDKLPDRIFTREAEDKSLIMEARSGHTEIHRRAGLAKKDMEGQARSLVQDA